MSITNSASSAGTNAWNTDKRSCQSMSEGISTRRRAVRLGKRCRVIPRVSPSSRQERTLRAARRVAKRKNGRDVRVNDGRRIVKGLRVTGGDLWKRRRTCLMASGVAGDATTLRRAGPYSGFEASSCGTSRGTTMLHELYSRVIRYTTQSRAVGRGYRCENTLVICALPRISQRCRRTGGEAALHGGGRPSAVLSDPVTDCDRGMFTRYCRVAVRRGL